MYKVFFNEKTIIISSNKDNLPNELWQMPNNRSQIRSLLFDFIDSEDDMYILSSSPSQILEAIKGEFNYIEAAGGLVENEFEEVLFIYRLDFWDFPKGKIEPGESPEMAAYREIMEECGIKSHVLQHHLTDTYHIYRQNDRMFLKKTFWYYFVQEDYDEETNPQKEEYIEQISWFGDVEVGLAFLDSYESIKMVYNSYQNIKK